MASPAEFMKAIQFSSAAGGLEKNLKLNTKATLPPSANSLKDDEILVKVITAAINPADYKFQEIWLVSQLLLKKDTTPGMDYAGRVIATGHFSGHPLPTDPKPGQLVFGRLAGPQATQFGTLAEYTVAPRNGCVPFAEDMDPDEAVCAGTAGLTAYQSLVPHVKPGNHIFINGGSGGCGTWAIQFAKVMGCHVVTSCSGSNIELCKSLGADEVIDYRAQDIVAELKKLERFDLIVDNVNSPYELYWEAHKFTNLGAKFVQVGGAPTLSDALSILKKMLWPGFLGGGKLSFEFLDMQNKSGPLAQIREWIQQGKVKAIIDEKFFLDEEGAIRAYSKLKTGRARGKIIVGIGHDTT